MKFCSLVLELHLPQNFCHTHTQTHRHTDTHTHRQTDRHFPKIVKSCLGHPKTCKSIENRKSKISTKPILSSTYTEESKKMKRVINSIKLRDRSPETYEIDQDKWTEQVICIKRQKEIILLFPFT